MYATPASRRTATIGDIPVTDEESHTYRVPAYALGGCRGQSAFMFADHEPRTRETSIREHELTGVAPSTGTKPSHGAPGGSIERDFEPKDRGLHKQDVNDATPEEKTGIDNLYAAIM